MSSRGVSKSSGGIFDLPRLKEEYERISAESQAPAFWATQERAQTQLKERSRIKNIIDSVESREAAVEEAELLLEMAKEEGELSVLDEIAATLEASEKVISTMEVSRMLGGDHDLGPAIVSINAGAGGTESQDWAEMLLRMITRYCEHKGYSVGLTDWQSGEEAGIKSATLQVEGEYAYGMLKAESGVHRLVRISPFDANARRHTSFASIFVFPEIDDSIEIEIDEGDLRIDVYRSSGAGGQHVNRTESAVRITHLPTNTVVACQNERSQHKNKATAMKQLKSRLYEKELREREKAKDAVNATKRAIDFGSQIRSYVLHPYQLVKDHRTNLEVGNVNAVLDGDLDALITTYLLANAGGPALPGH
ncbi:MAG: peptide chain release factor 2 [Deltaproteobacteria bacterium CG_4_9_14_3_um_filter_63_12]|nr:MAG: peptide chain release factor 2 [Deltaproteobacteria bacterium CG_4_9_14_3_um_filter_63_12]